MTMHEMTRIYERAAAQLGLLTFHDLEVLGVTRSRRTRLIAQGHLVRAGRRTLRVVGAPQSMEHAMLLACLDHEAVLSHRTAARLHGLHGFESFDRIEVTTRHRRAPTRRASPIVHTTTWLPADDVVSIGALPVTSVARTLFGLAALAPAVTAERLRDTVDVAIRDGVASERWLWWRLEQLRCRGRNGVHAFEQVLLQRVPGGVPQSWLEREFLRLVQAAGLPMPVCQRRIEHDGAFVARVDFAFPPTDLVVEVSGHGTHSSRAQWNADLHRTNLLVLAGCRKLEFTYDDLVARPDEVVVTLAAALGVTLAA